jgi:hypothetical protein
MSMKKILPFLLLGIVLLSAAVLLFTADDDREKFLDERITLRRTDKIPYGTYVAYEGLHHLFPSSTVTTNRKAPSNWDNLSMEETGQALVIISHRFFADNDEMLDLIKFAEKGNDVFVSAMVYAEDAKNLLNCSVSYFDLSEIFSPEPVTRDSLSVTLANPPFARSYHYSFPGLRFDSHFIRTDTSISNVMGYNQGGNKNFLHFRAGNGNLYFHLAPLAFSNYFLLHRQNLNYYENVLSVLSPGVKKIVWDEYFLNKRFYYEEKSEDDRTGWFNTFMKYRGLRWALLTAILILLAFVLFEMARKQRYIPVIAKPRNDSLEFVKTIGRLYFEKGDHVNLARKMSAYFLEYVRNKYKLATGSMDNDFFRKLQFKTGVPEEELQPIIRFIIHLDAGGGVTAKQLSEFHKQLESFYHKA